MLDFLVMLMFLVGCVTSGVAFIFLVLWFLIWRETDK
jgi:hypothetical protein